MDQMASACGEANKLLAMVCQVTFSNCCLNGSIYILLTRRHEPVLLLPVQPAEVLGLVDIPGHIRFWGIDSGIRHRYQDPLY